MPRYFDYKFSSNGTGVVLYHSDGAEYVPSRIAAEQKIISAVHGWAAENVDEAKRQMDLLTRFVRER